MTDWINAFWDVLFSLVSNGLEVLFRIIGFVFYCVFDGLLAVVYAFVQTLDLSSVAFSMASEWSSLPDQLIWLINALALPQCITILAGAMSLRMLVNLIPAAFTRV